MTIKEALREAYENCTECKLVNDCVKEECRWHHIIKALEKQMPKKPKFDMCENPICPRCEVPYITDEYDVIYEFCPCCGQRIDWSDTDKDD